LVPFSRFVCYFAEGHDFFGLIVVERVEYPAITGAFRFEILVTQPKRELLTVKVAADPPTNRN